MGVDAVEAARVGGLLVAVLVVAGYVWLGLSLSAMFRKMGEEPWRGWVPVLNMAAVLRWGGFSPWLALLFLVPGLNLVAYVLLIVAVHRLNPGFGYRDGMTVLAAFLFIVWATIVGFGPAQWRGAHLARTRPSPRPVAPPSVEVPARPTPPPVTTEAWPSAAAPAPAPWTPPSPVEPTPWTPPAANAGAGSAWAPPAATSEPRTAPILRRTESAPEPEEIPDAGDDWPSEVDEVSAVSPSPFPPNAAAPTRPFVAPPVGEMDAGPLEPLVGRTGDPGPLTRVPRPGEAPGDVFPELTDEVSAVVGSPAAGSPVSARRSVSAQQEEPHAPAESVEETVLARRRGGWLLIPDGSDPIALVSDIVVLGRRPVPDPGRPGAQVIALADPTRTVSKTHARLERRGDAWFITDLSSTNGTLLPGLLGADVELPAGEEAEVADRFLLGDAALRLQRRG